MHGVAKTKQDVWDEETSSFKKVEHFDFTNAKDDDTRLTKAFSGRPARARKNDYIESIAAHRLPLPEFPTMYALSGPLREASNDILDYRFLLYGQAATLNREMKAAELVQTLVKEAHNLL